MKKPFRKLFLIAVLLLPVRLGAAPTIWTSKDGRTATMELVAITEKDGEKAGEFKMSSGRSVILKASELSPESAAKLAAWTAPETAQSKAATASVYDEILEDNVVQFEGESLKKTKFVKPKKYYLFYHTASWCGPCQRFTPSLVDFYNKNKNADFEVILISSDADEKAMEGYAKEKKMPWPQLSLAKVGDFQKKFNHPGRGIPNLVLTDTQGNIIKGSYEGAQYIGPTPVMNHLAELLKK